jgi:hypothetical protein
MHRKPMLRADRSMNGQKLSSIHTRAHFNCATNAATIQKLDDFLWHNESLAFPTFGIEFGKKLGGQ